LAWTWRHECVVAGNLWPVRLRLRAGSEVKTDPDIGVVRAKHGNALILRGVLDLISERPVAQCLLGHVLGYRIVRDVPVCRAKRSVTAINRLPNPGRASNKMSAAPGNARP